MHLFSCLNIGIATFPLTTFFVSEKTYLKGLEIPELTEDDMPVV